MVWYLLTNSYFCLTLVPYACTQRYDFKNEVELYELNVDIGEKNDVSQTYPAYARLAIKFMDEAHKPGPHCGYLPPDPN